MHKNAPKCTKTSKISSKMPQNGQNLPKMIKIQPKMTKIQPKMIINGRKWPKFNQNCPKFDQKRSKMAKKNDQNWTQLLKIWPKMDTNGQNLPKNSHQWAKNAKIRTERCKNGQMLLQKRFKPGTVKSARAPRALARGTRALQACNIQLPLQGLKSCQLPPQGLLCAVLGVLKSF